LENVWSKLSPNYIINGFRKTGLYPFNKNAINESVLKMAIPWTDSGFQHRFGDEINKINQEQHPFVSHCLKAMRNIISPPITTTITQVISYKFKPC
jgi:hypothetical protein